MKALSFSTYLVIVSLLLWPASPALADAAGADLKILSEMYMNMKKQLEQLKQQVDQLKASNDFIKGMQSDINDLRHEYYFVKGFDPNADVTSLKNWANDEIGLSGMKDANTLDQKWSIINRELNKRFERSKQTPNSVDNAQRQAIKDLIAQLKQNEKEQINYLKAAQQANKNPNTKTLEQINASANAMLANIELQKRQKELEAELQRREQLLNQMENDYSFLQYLAK